MNSLLAYEWLIIILFLVSLYLAIVSYIKSNNL